MNERYFIIVDRKGLRWSNEFGWTNRPFDIFVGTDWDLPVAGRWESLPEHEPIEKGATKNIRIGKKVWALPMVLLFPGGWYLYNVVGFRPPKKGEYYLSGGPVEVWIAPSNLSTPFLVVVKSDRAIRFQGWTREEI